MRILITGNMGYVGSVLARHLRAEHPAWLLEGYDTGYFAHCLTGPGPLPETVLDRQHFGDVRALPAALLDGVDAVVALAAISNDPMGARFEQVTDAINHRAVVALAHAARHAGVRAFVFASSCSLYGAAEGPPRREDDPVNPLTAYARSKIDTERALQDLDAGPMAITCLRFATACGLSPRLRLDLVLNDFVASALATGEISVLSDGTPWRPLIDVADMARAIDWAIQRRGEKLVCNTGSDGWNWQVATLAEAVAMELPGTRVRINHNAPPDRRSYQVDFSRFRALAPDHQPQMTLHRAIAALREGLRAIAFADENFRDGPAIRLKQLEQHIDTGRLTPALHWRPA